MNSDNLILPQSQNKEIYQDLGNAKYLFQNCHIVIKINHPLLVTDYQGFFTSDIFIVLNDLRICSCEEKYDCCFSVTEF